MQLIKIYDLNIWILDKNVKYVSYNPINYRSLSITTDTLKLGIKKLYIFWTLKSGWAPNPMFSNAEADLSSDVTKRNHVRSHPEAVPQSYITLWSEATGTQPLSLSNELLFLLELQTDVSS